MDECYPLAFGVPAMLMFVALTLFLLGNRMYIKIPPQGNCHLRKQRFAAICVRKLILRFDWRAPKSVGPCRRRSPAGDAVSRVLKVIREAMAQRRKNRNGPTTAHWLDGAVPRFGGQAVQDVKDLLNVLVIFVPVPLFWTLFDQTASRYVILAVEHI